LQFLRKNGDFLLLCGISEQRFLETRWRVRVSGLKYSFAVHS